MAVEEIKQTNEAHKEQVESLQRRLERNYQWNYHELVAMKQQFIKVERSQVECRQCRQIFKFLEFNLIFVFMRR